MKKVDLINILNKVLLGEEKEKFFDTRTTDGKILRIEADVLQNGASVYSILEDGTIGAIDDGSYILDSGETVNVQGGRVESFIPVSVDAPAEDVESPTEDAMPGDSTEDVAPAADAEAPAEDAAPGDVVEEIANADGSADVVTADITWEEAVKALADEIKALKDAMGQMQMSNEALKSHVAQFSKLPSETEIKKEKQGFKTEDEKNKDLRLANLEKIKALRTQK